MHKMPLDLQKSLATNKAARAAWESLTPLARNEWICWVTSVKKDETKKGTYSEISDRAQRRKTPAMLLDRLYSSHRQSDQPFGARNTK